MSENNTNFSDFYKLALDSVTDQIVVSDKNGNVIYVNNAITKVTGYTKEEAIGTKAGKLWGDIMPKEFYADMWDRLVNKKQTYDGVLKNRRKDSTVYDARISISPILDECNNISFFVGIERDITHEKEVDRMKTEFISLVSHQLRTPLSAIKWNLEMILDDKKNILGSDLKTTLKEIDNSNERMIDLINFLLNISRIESGRIIINPTPVNIRQLIDSLSNELKPKLTEKEISLEISYDGVEREINMDAKLIRHALINLLTNSIKYTNDKGMVKIIIKFEDEGILFEIADNGLGIPKNQQDKIFTKFFRADNVLGVFQEGTGLGLYLVKSIIDASGGKIWFESEENTYTKFYFRLPDNPPVKEGDVYLS